MQNQNYQQPRQGNNQGGNGQPTNQAPELARITIDEIEFGGTLKTEITTTIELCNRIVAIFKPVFADWEGCIILPDQSGQLQLQIFFKDKGNAGKDQIKNITNAINPTKGLSGMDRIRNMNVRNSNKTYELTKETKEILSEFIYCRQGQQIQWNNLVMEVTEPVYNGYQIYVRVVGIDLMRILKKLYGKKSGASYHDYSITQIKPVSQFSNDNSNHLISITQLDTKKVENLCQKIGMIPLQGNISMVR